MELNLGRVRRFEWAGAALGVLLVADTFVPWYRVVTPSARRTVNAWQALTVIEVIVAIAALMGIALATMAALQRTSALAVTITALMTLVAGAASALLVYRAARSPELSGLLPGAASAGHVQREAGLWLGLAGCLALTVSGWRNMTDDQAPAALAPTLAVTPLRAPAPDGHRRTVAE